MSTFQSRGISLVPITTGWNDFSIVGGGFITGIDITSDGTLVARTDTYGCYLWGGTEWQQLINSSSLPASMIVPNEGQGVREIRIAPSNTSVFYCTYQNNILVSTNSGHAWSKSNLFSTFPSVTFSPNDNTGIRLTGRTAAIDPNNSNVFYVGDDAGAIFYTFDGGNTWGQISIGVIAVSGQPVCIAFDPSSGTTGGKTNTIYIATPGGIYASTNAGGSFSPLTGGPSGGAEHMIAQPSGGIMWLTDSTGSDTNLWSYTHSGGWVNYTGCVAPNSSTWFAVAVNPNNLSQVVVIEGAGSITQSLNAGVSWTSLGTASASFATDGPWLAASNQGYLAASDLLFNPLEDNELIIADGIGVWITTLPSSGIYNLTSQTLGIEQLVANSILSPPSSNPIVCSWDRSIFYKGGNPNTAPSEVNWVSALAIQQCWQADYAGSNFSFLIANCDAYSAYSADGGVTWTQFGSVIPSNSGAGGGIAAISETNWLWVTAEWGGGLWLSQNSGASWSEVLLPGGSAQGTTTLTGGPYLAGATTLTVASSSGMVTNCSLRDGTYSNDFGNYLVEVTNISDNTITINPGVPVGATWNSGDSIQIVSGLAGFANYVGRFPICVDHQTGYSYAVVAGILAGNGVFQSTNNGVTWSSVYSGTIISGDNYQGAAQFCAALGQAGVLFFQNGSGVAVSFNSAVSWQGVANFTQANAIGVGATKPGNNFPSVYIVGTFNGNFGVWRSDSSSSAWEANTQTWVSLGEYPGSSMDSITCIVGDANTWGVCYLGCEGSGYKYYRT